jgi:4-amino-4-deoxy-L-arabinose transferase-like glycosyltransferase
MGDSRDAVAVNEPSRDLAYSAILGMVALVPRLFVAIAWSREPVWDGHYYHFGAQRIAAGLGYSEDVVINGATIWKPWCHYPVGYSAFLGGLYRVFGSSLIVAPIANALVGALTVVVVHRVARYYLSEPRARVAGGIAALHPGLIVYTVVVMTEPLAGFLLLAAGWFALHWRGRWLGIAMGGLAVGLATLVRPASILAAPLLLVTQPKPWWNRLRVGAVATALAVLVVVPWTIRNCQVMDGCAFVSTNAGWNLAIGALTDTGRFVGLTADDGCRVVTGQVQQDRCWAKVGRDAIARDPHRWLSLIPQKLAHTFSHESFAIEYLGEADPRAWPAARREAGRNLLSLFHRGLLVAAALGMVGRLGFRSSYWRNLLTQGFLLGLVAALAIYGFSNDYHPFHWVAIAIPAMGLLPLPGRPWQGGVGHYLLGLLLATALTHAVFFGDDRYHIVVTPALCVLAAGALRVTRDQDDIEGSRPAVSLASRLSLEDTGSSS